MLNLSIEPTNKEIMDKFISLIVEYSWFWILLFLITIIVALILVELFEKFKKLLVKIIRKIRGKDYKEVPVLVTTVSRDGMRHHTFNVLQETIKPKEHPIAEIEDD